MKRFILAAALAATAVGLGGCLTALGRTTVGPLKPMEVGLEQTVTCAELVRSIRDAAARVDEAQAASGLPSPDTALAMRLKNVELLKVIAQTDAAYEACERKEAGQRVRIDVEAGRQLGIRGLAP